MKLNKPEDYLDDEWNLVIDENAKKMLSQDAEQVDFFLRTTMTKVLDLIDQVEDDSLHAKLLGIGGVFMGAMSRSLLELRKDNDRLRGDVLNDYLSDQNPDIN